MSIDELAEIYDKVSDRVIIKKEQEENLNYVGGQFAITYITDDIFFSQG